MRDHIDDAFDGLTTDIARHTLAPGAGAAITSAQRRRAGRVGGVGVAVAGIAVWATVLASGGTPSVIEPAGEPSQRPSTEQTTAEATAEPPTDFDVAGLPPEVWLREDSLVGLAGGNWQVEVPERREELRGVPECVNEVMADEDIWSQVATDGEGAYVGHSVFTQVTVAYPIYGLQSCADENGSVVEPLTDDYGPAKAAMFRVTGEHDPYLVAVGGSFDGVAFASYVGPGAGSAEFGDGISAESPIGVLLESVGKVVAVQVPGGDIDRFLPSGVPDSVWLQQDDLQTIAPETWASFGRTDGVSGAVPGCLAEALESADNWRYQQASTQSGETVIHHSRVTNGESGGGDFWTTLDSCADIIGVATWDATVSGTATARVIEGETSYAVGHNSNNNGDTVTIYVGPRYDEPKDFKSDFSSIMRDFANHGNALFETYTEACKVVGECSY